MNMCHKSYRSIAKLQKLYYHLLNFIKGNYNILAVPLYPHMMGSPTTRIRLCTDQGES